MGRINTQGFAEHALYLPYLYLHLQAVQAYHSHLPTLTPYSQAKVSIGVPARAVAFSPNGAHLAVGTNTGEIKVRGGCIPPHFLVPFPPTL